MLTRERTLLAGAIELGIREGCVVVVNRRPAQDLDEARQVTDAIEDMLRITGRGALVFDGRHNSERTSEPVKLHMREWLSSCPLLKAVAMVVREDLHVRMTNLSAIAKGTQLEAFTSLPVAVGHALRSARRADAAAG